MAKPTATLSFVDKAKKPSSVQLLVSATNITSWMGTPGSGVIFNLFAALAGVSLLNETGRKVSVDLPSVDPSYPTDDQAYRSSKLTVFVFDSTTGAKSHFTVPGRDPASYNTTPGTKDVILDGSAGGTAEIVALVDAVQAGVYSEDGNLVTVRSIVVSGANQG